MSIKVLITEGITAIVGLFILFQLTKGLCEADASFCTYGWDIFGVIFVGMYFILKYGFIKK
jgi:hypothetical protein